MNRPTSQYQRKYHKSPAEYDPVTGKRIFAPRTKINIRHNKNQLFGDEDAEGEHTFSVEGEGESSYKYAKDMAKRPKTSVSALGTYEGMASLDKYRPAGEHGDSAQKSTYNRKYGKDRHGGTGGKIKKTKAQDYPGYAGTPGSKLAKQQRLGKKDASESDDIEPEHSSQEESKYGSKLSKSKAISYQDPKYLSEKVSKSIKKYSKGGEKPDSHKERSHLIGKESSGEYSGDFKEDDERDSDDRAQETPHSHSQSQQPGKMSESYRKKLAETKSGSKHSMQKSGKIGKRKGNTFKQGKDQQHKQYEATGLRGKGEIDPREKYLRSLDDKASFEGEEEEGRSGHEFGSSHQVYPHYDTHGENVEYHQDENVQYPRDHSDYYHSVKDIQSQKYIGQEESNKGRGLRTYEIMKGKDKRSPMKGAKGQPIEGDIKGSSFSQRRKSKYRETKDQLRSKHRSRASIDQDIHGHTKSVEVDLTDKDREGSIPKMQDKYQKFLTHEASEEDDLYEDSKHDRESSDYKILKSKEHKGIKKYDLRKYKGEDKTRPGTSYHQLEGDIGREGESDEMIDEQYQRDPTHHKMIHKSGKKKQPQSHSQTDLKEGQPSKKQYDLQQRMRQKESDKYQEGAEDDAEEYKYGDQRLKDKFGRTHSKESMEDESKHTPRKTYDISKGHKKPTSTHKKGMKSSSDEGEGYHSKSGKKLPHQGSSDSESKNLRKDVKKFSKSELSPPEQKRVKADLKAKAKLSHGSLKKIGKRDDQKVSQEDEGDHEAHGDTQERRKKYDIQGELEKTNSQKLRERQQQMEEGKHTPSAGTKKLKGKSSSDDSQGFSSRKQKSGKKIKKSKPAQMEEFEDLDNQSPPLVAGEEYTHHDPSEYDEATKRHVKEKGRYVYANLGDDEEGKHPSKHEKHASEGSYEFGKPHKQYSLSSKDEAQSSKRHKKGKKSTLDDPERRQKLEKGKYSTSGEEEGKTHKQRKQKVKGQSEEAEGSEGSLTEIKKKGTLKGRKDKQDSHSLKGKATKGKQKIGKQSSSEESAGKIKGKGKQSKGGKQKKDELEHGDIHHLEVAEESKYHKKVIDYSPKDDSQRIKGQYQRGTHPGGIDDEGKYTPSAEKDQKSGIISQKHLSPSKMSKGDRGDRQEMYDEDETKSKFFNNLLFFI